MGKSRLVAELEPDARALGYAWTWTESVSYGRGEPYRFARLFAQAVADEHGVDSGSFARQLLFGADVDPATVKRLRRRDRGDRPGRGLRRAGRPRPRTSPTIRPRRPRSWRGRDRLPRPLLATDGPRVVVLDDVHWIDPRARASSSCIVARPRRTPARRHRHDAPRPGASLGRPAARRAADRWAVCQPPETAQLATIVARAALDADDARRIHERTEGNPLFIGETVRASIEDGTPRAARRPDDARRAGRAAAAADPASRARRSHRRPRRAGPRRPRCRVGHRHRLPRRATSRTCSSGRSPPGTLDRLVDAALDRARTETGTWRFSHPLGPRRGIRRACSRPAPAAAPCPARGSPRGGARPVSVRGASPSTGRRPATPCAPSRCSSRRPVGGLAMGAAAEAAGFWRTAADSRRTRPTRRASGTPPARRWPPLGPNGRARARRPRRHRAGTAGRGRTVRVRPATAGDPRPRRVARGLEVASRRSGS